MAELLFPESKNPEEPIQLAIFVRHGEAVHNVPPHHNDDPEWPLTPKGEQQARSAAIYLGKRLKDDPNFVGIVTGPYKRQLQTAQAIAETTEREIVPTSQLREMRQASILRGTKRDAAEIKPIQEKASQAKYAEKPEERFEDQETFNQVAMRGQRDAVFFRAMYPKTVVAVSSNLTIKATIGALLEGAVFDGEALEEADKSPPLSNASITVLWSNDGQVYHQAAYNFTEHIPEDLK